MNASATFFLPRKSLSFTGLRFWSSRVKSGAVSPTLNLGSGGGSFLAPWAHRPVPACWMPSASMHNSKTAGLLRMTFLRSLDDYRQVSLYCLRANGQLFIAETSARNVLVMQVLVSAEVHHEGTHPTGCGVPFNDRLAADGTDSCATKYDFCRSGRQI